MRTDQEDSLIYSIRSGAVVHKDITIVPATIEQMYRANKEYSNAYDRAESEGLMSDKGLELWMIENNILPSSFYSLKKQILDNIDSLKRDLFRNRFSKRSIKEIKSNLKNTRAKLSDLLKPKNEMSQNTCEFIAHTQKIIYVLKETTFKRNKLYKTNDFYRILNVWQDSLLSETTIRELCRSSTWRSIWNSRGFGFDLFQRRKNTEMTINQRNLLTWSKIYDNVQESLECPSEKVIEDDDMLDGWFLVQKIERERERVERERESSSSKSKQASKLANAEVMFSPKDEFSDMANINEGLEDNIFQPTT
jgi:hypothetical protein